MLKSSNTSSGDLGHQGIKGWVLDDPPTVDSYNFESLDMFAAFSFCENYWYLPVIIGALYISIIHKLQEWMKTRRPFQLTYPLFLWNLSLGICSIVAFVRSTPTLIYVLQEEEGFYKSICIRKGLNQVNIFWGYWFVFLVSKVVELGDTIFIILRKKPLVFLQWYHHLVTMILSWAVTPAGEPINRWFAATNYFVHSFMYPYFALKTIRMPIPQFVRTSITALQFLQMIIGVMLNIASVYIIRNGIYCARETYSIIAFFAVYGSFTFLFGNLLYHSLKKTRNLEKLHGN